MTLDQAATASRDPGVGNTTLLLGLFTDVFFWNPGPLLSTISHPNNEIIEFSMNILAIQYFLDLKVCGGFKSRRRKRLDLCGEPIDNQRT